MAGAYIHIPFCEHICYYCDFNKVFIEGQPVDDYVAMLLKEMRMVMAEHPEEKIEIGLCWRWHPTTLTPQQLAVLCQGIRDILHFDHGELPLKPSQ